MGASREEKAIPQMSVKISWSLSSFSSLSCVSQHILYPEVYILIIPAFGIISIIISGVLQKIIFGNQSMIFAMSCISLLGSVVWGHHMYSDWHSSNLFPNAFPRI